MSLPTYPLVFFVYLFFFLPFPVMPRRELPEVPSFMHPFSFFFLLDFSDPPPAPALCRFFGDEVRNCSLFSELESFSSLHFLRLRSRPKEHGFRFVEFCIPKLSIRSGLLSALVFGVSTRPPPHRGDLPLSAPPRGTLPLLRPARSQFRLFLERHVSLLLRPPGSFPISFVASRLFQ